MNDLRELMDRAAGEPDALTNADLREFARSGRKAARLRRGVGLAAVSAATAGVIAIALLVAPGGPQADSGVAGQATPDPSARRRAIPPGAGKITPPPRPVTPVPLIAKTVSSTAGGVACDLSPKGWTLAGQTLRLKDPRYPKDNESFDHITVQRSEFGNATDGSKILPKTDRSWDEVPHYQAGPYQAVVNNFPPESRLPLTADGQRDIFVKVRGNTLLQVWTVAPRLGWDLRTALRFAGSCRLIN